MQSVLASHEVGAEALPTWGDKDLLAMHSGHLHHTTLERVLCLMLKLFQATVFTTRPLPGWCMCPKFGGVLTCKPVPRAMLPPSPKVHTARPLPPRRRSFSCCAYGETLLPCQTRLSCSEDMQHINAHLLVQLRDLARLRCLLCILLLQLLVISSQLVPLLHSVLVLALRLHSP